MTNPPPGGFLLSALRVSSLFSTLPHSIPVITSWFVLFLGDRDVELVIICAILGCIPAAIAKSKGRDFGAWWLYGALLFIVALIHSLVIKKDIRSIEQSQLNEGLVKCPFCAEMIKPEAIKCKHCGSDLPANLAPKPTSIDYDFKPTSIPVEQYVNRSGDVVSINSGTVIAMVERLKQANVGANAVNLESRYADDIEILKLKLPPAIRSEFTMIYESVLKG